MATSSLVRHFAWPSTIWTCILNVAHSAIFVLTRTLSSLSMVCKGLNARACASLYKDPAALCENSEEMLYQLSKCLLYTLLDRESGEAPCSYYKQSVFESIQVLDLVALRKMTCVDLGVCSICWWWLAHTPFHWTT